MKKDLIIAQSANKIIYRDGDHTVKLFNESYSVANILNEALNTARVAETELDVPAIIEVGKIDGKWAITLEYVEGDTLASLMEKHPEKKVEYIALMVDVQMNVHAQKCPLLNHLTDKMMRKLEEADIDSGLRYELQTRLAGMHRHDKVCHGDFNPSNLIVRPNGSVAIVDWAHVTQGNASADVARTYLLFCLNGRKDDAELYMNLFCEKSGTDRRYVEKWLPIVAASQSVKGKPEEREFLLNWTNVVDYE